MLEYTERAKFHPGNEDAHVVRKLFTISPPDTYDITDLSPLRIIWHWRQGRPASQNIYTY